MEEIDLTADRDLRPLAVNCSSCDLAPLRPSVRAVERRPLAGGLSPTRDSADAPCPPFVENEAVRTRQDRTASVTLPGIGRQAWDRGKDPHYGQLKGRRINEPGSRLRPT